MAEIFKISQASSLAFHSLLLIAQNSGSKLTTEKLAKKLGASQAHLAKVLQTLSRQGFIRARRGPGGGYELARPCERISLLDIYQAIEGKFIPQKCLLEKKICKGECIFGGFLERVNKELKDYFARTYLSEFVKK